MVVIARAHASCKAGTADGYYGQHVMMLLKLIGISSQRLKGPEKGLS